MALYNIGTEDNPNFVEGYWEGGYGNEAPIFRRADAMITVGDAESGYKMIPDPRISNLNEIELSLKNRGFNELFAVYDKNGNRISGGFLEGYWQDPSTGKIYGTQQSPSQWYYGAKLDPNTGAYYVGNNPELVKNAALSYGAQSRTSGGDFITDFLDTGGGVAALMALASAGAATGFGGALSASPVASTIPNVASELAGLQASTTGLGSSIGGQSIVNQFISNLPSISTMAQNAAINAATQFLTTGDIDPSKVLTSIVTGAAGTAVGSTVANNVLSATDSALAASIASGAAKGVFTAAINGNDPLQTALASAAASGLGYVAKDYGISIPQTAINSVISSVSNGAPLDQVLTGAVIAAGTGVAKDLISSAYNAYNADQQTSGLQAASDLGNAPVQGFDNNGNPIYRDSSGVWTNGQGVQVDPATGEPTQTIDTSSVEVTPYKQADAVSGTELPIYQNTALPSDQVTGALPSAQQVMPEIVVKDQQPATTTLPYKTDYTGSSVSDTGEIPPVIGGYPVQQNTSGEWVSGYDLPSGYTQTSSAPTPAPVTTTVPVSGLPTAPANAGGTSGTPSGSSGSSQKATDVSQYVNPIPAYLQPTLLSTGQPSQVSSLWAGLDPKLANILTQRFAHGGSIHPQLMKVLQERGGDLVPGPENRLYMRHAKRGFAVEGPGTGQSDDIPTMLADGEYVFDADTVAALGDGSSKAGAEALDKMREAIRAHKRSAPVDKIPPKAKSPLEYLKMAKRK